MQPLKTSIHKNKTWRPVIFFAIGLIAGAIIFSLINIAFIKKSKDDYNKTITRIINSTDSLQTGFTRLQQLNEKYAALLSDKNLDSAKIIQLDSLNINITHREVDFSKLLDSLEANNHSYNENAFNLFSRIINGYRDALNQSSAISTIRNSFNIGNTDFSFDQNTLYTMQAVLHTRETELVGLNNHSNNTKEVTRPTSDIDYKGLMHDQDSAVNKVLEAQKNKNENLVSYNNKLKQDNDKLNNELTALRSSDYQSKVVSSATVSKQEMNEQVSLAKIDCYLSRADATEIISNARQRKDLLQKALQLLNTLSQSSNIATQQEVQSKLSELKTIAANNHD